MKTMLKQTLIVLLGILMTQPVLAQDWIDDYVNDGTASSTNVEEEDEYAEEEYSDVTRQEGYYIDNYTVDVTVHEDNVLSVKEKIDVVFTERSHGIYRMIPSWVYVERDVSEKQDHSKTKMMRYEVKIEGMECSDPWTIMEEYDDELLPLRFGEAGVTFDGPHTYYLKYDYKIPADRIKEADVFFFSPYGKGWKCETKNLNFTIHFDKALSADALQKLQVFTGKLGNGDNVASEIVAEATSTMISGSKKDLNPYEAVTIFIPLEEGYFNAEEQGNAPMMLLFGALALVLALYVIYDEVAKREVVTKVVSFYPPEGSSSAEVGTLIDTSVDDRDMISLIPWFAQQGYITIDNTGEHPVLLKIKEIDSKSPNFCKTLFNGFFPEGKDVFDTGNVGNSFGAAWLNAKEQATKFYTNKLNTVKGFILVLLLAAIVCTGVINAFACNNPNAPIFGIVSAGALAIITLAQIFRGDKKSVGSSLIAYTVAALCGVVMWAIFMYYAVEGDDLTFIDYRTLAGINLFTFAACILANRLTIMTPYRKERIGIILGLHDFIDTAEKAQLQQLQNEDEKYFYNVLPYAVAFGMVDKWTAKFNGIKVAPVDWYKGNDMTSMQAFNNFNAGRMMSNSLRDSITREQIARERAAAAQSASSASSARGGSVGGFGGGGFSGGGFGGGGGGRW